MVDREIEKIKKEAEDGGLVKMVVEDRYSCYICRDGNIEYVPSCGHSVCSGCVENLDGRCAICRCAMHKLICNRIRGIADETMPEKEPEQAEIIVLSDDENNEENEDLVVNSF